MSSAAALEVTEVVGCFQEGGDRSRSLFRCSEAATDSFTAGVAALVESEHSLCRNEKFSPDLLRHVTFHLFPLLAPFAGQANAVS